MSEEETNNFNKTTGIILNPLERLRVALAYVDHNHGRLRELTFSMINDLLSFLRRKKHENLFLLMSKNVYLELEALIREMFFTSLIKDVSDKPPIKKIVCLVEDKYKSNSKELGLTTSGAKLYGIEIVLIEDNTCLIDDGGWELDRIYVVDIPFTDRSHYFTIINIIADLLTKLRDLE